MRQTPINQQLRGVNLGGWLVLEKWMTPSLFVGMQAKDEYSFCLEKGINAQKSLEKHWSTFITEADFRWLSEHGINAVRIPVGYWIFGDVSPFVGNVQYLDWAFTMAKKYHLKVLIDLHAAPGSQNGFDHSGRVGAVNWFKRANRNETQAVLEKLVKRYGKHESLWGIELLNEPAIWWYLRYFVLRSWTKRVVASLTSSESHTFRIIFSDAYVPWFMSGLLKHSKHSVMDIHHYQCFSRRHKQKSLDEHLEIARSMRARIDAWQIKQPVIIGEWSLVFDHASLKGTNRRKSEMIYGQAQLQAFENAAGWFFWSYKMEGQGGWNFRYCVDNGYLKF